MEGATGLEPAASCVTEQRSEFSLTPRTRLKHLSLLQLMLSHLNARRRHALLDCSLPNPILLMCLHWIGERSYPAEGK